MKLVFFFFFVTPKVSKQWRFTECISALEKLFINNFLTSLPGCLLPSVKVIWVKRWLHLVVVVVIYGYSIAEKYFHNCHSPYSYVNGYKRIILPACRYLNCIIDAYVFYDRFVAAHRLQWLCLFQIQILYKFIKHLYANNCVCLFVVDSLSSSGKYHLKVFPIKIAY